VAREEIEQFARRVDELSNASVFNARAVGEKAAVELVSILTEMECRLAALEKKANES